MKDEKPYIKKPLNAFMLFMKEQRPTIAPELRKQGSGPVNAVLGTMVTVLCISVKLKYTHIINVYVYYYFVWSILMSYPLSTVGLNVREREGRIFHRG